MKKLFRKSLLSLGLLSLVAGGLTFFLRTNLSKEVKADAVESITLSDLATNSYPAFAAAAKEEGFTYSSGNVYGELDWLNNDNTIDLHFNAVVSAENTSFSFRMPNGMDECGVRFIVHFNNSNNNLMVYANQTGTANYKAWQTANLDLSSHSNNELYFNFKVTVDITNAKLNADIKVTNLTRNTGEKSGSINDISMSPYTITEENKASKKYLRFYEGNTNVRNFVLYDHWNKITFVDDNGNSVRQVTRNNAIGTLPTPVGRLGAEFLGWFDDKGNEVTASTLSTHSMTVRAKYSYARPFKGVTLRDVNLGNEVTLTGNGANIYGRYDIFDAASENKLDLSFNMKFNNCIESYTGSGSGLALDIHYPNKQNDGTPKSRIYFGKNSFSAYFRQGSGWTDGFVTTSDIKFNDTDTFLINFVVIIDGSNITMSATATNLTTNATGSLTRTFAMTNIPTSDYTYIRINNISDDGGVKATMTNAWDTPTKQYIKYLNGEEINTVIVDKNVALDANQVSEADTDSKLFYRYVDENDNPVREGYVVNRDITLTATYVDKTDNGYAKQFTERYMKPDISTSDSGSGKCISEGWYNYAKAAFNALGLEARIEFLTNDEFADMKDRLAAWAAANGDEISDNQISKKSSSLFTLINNTHDDALMRTIVIISIISCTLISAGIFFLRKRKEQ